MKILIKKSNYEYMTHDLFDKSNLDKDLFNLNQLTLHRELNTIDDYPPPLPLQQVRQHRQDIPDHEYNYILLDDLYDNTFNNDYEIFKRYYNKLNSYNSFSKRVKNIEHNLIYFKIVCLIKVFNGNYDNIPNNHKIIELILNDPECNEYFRINIYRILWDEIDTLNGFFDKPKLLYGRVGYIHNIVKYPLKLLECVFKKSPDYVQYKNDLQIDNNKMLYHLLYIEDNLPKLELLLNNPYLNINMFIDTEVCKLLLFKDVRIKNIEQVKILIFGFGLDGINMIELIDFIIKNETKYQKFDVINEIVAYKRNLTDDDVIRICSKIFNGEELLAYNKRKYPHIQQLLLNRLSKLKPATYKKIISSDLVSQIGVDKPGTISKIHPLMLGPEELTKQFLRDETRSKYIMNDTNHNIISSIDNIYLKKKYIMYKKKYLDLSNKI